MLQLKLRKMDAVSIAFGVIDGSPGPFPLNPQLYAVPTESKACSTSMKCTVAKKHIFTWWSGYCYEGECNLNQSKHDSFVERVAKNNSWNNGDRHKIHEIFLINCFVSVITLLCKTVHGSAMTQIKAHVMEKALQFTVPSVSEGWTKKPFGHYAILKPFPSDRQVVMGSLLYQVSTWINYKLRSARLCKK